MKTKQLISTAIACLLLTGCAANKSPAPKVNFADMFYSKTSSSDVLQESKVNGKAASPIDGNDTLSYDAEANTENTSSNGSSTVGKSAKAAPGETDQSADDTANDNTDNTASDSQNGDTEQAPNDVTSDIETNTPTKKVDNRNPKSVVYTDAQTVADLYFGDICYFPYKTGDEDVSEDENDSVPEGDDEESSKVENRRPKPKYDHGYRVVFRTETDTYLLGITPYDYCIWDDVDDMCLKIEESIEAECQMVGVPSFEDMKYFIDCGIVFPGQYEMWTQTPASPNGKKMYYRNQKGAIYSTKSQTEKCGVCAIIKISTTQNDPELLSSSLADYDGAKARLEAEEEQYKLAISEE